MFIEKESDFLIIGSGLAGLYSANFASQFGHVILVTKEKLNVSNSYYAQGGIAAVTDSDDSPDLHLKDTFEAGRGLCDFSPVKILVNEGPERIKDLIEMGMQFDTLEGQLSRGLEGGHHKRRVLHAGGDSTGKELIKFLTKKTLNNKNIEVLENQMVYKLICENKQCFGALAYNPNDNTNLKIKAKNTFLATGGASAIYQRTTNPHTTVGDGIALAFAEGVEVEDMEFIQFHPSAFYSENGNTFLISEAVRGEGAHLYNKQGERFMFNKHELAELAPRDIVARSIFEQMQNNNDRFVYLNLDHLNAEMIQKRFPTLYKKCAESGVDMCKRVPIAPAAHYMVGGIKTGLNGETNISNMYCFGELASSGVMGANRLASNSLLECLVFGKRAVIHANNQSLNSTYPKFNAQELHKACKLENEFLNRVNQIAITMNNKLGIVRCHTDICDLINTLEAIKNNFPFEDNEYYSLRMLNLLQVCKLMAKAALQRKESRGGHIRSDFEQESKAFMAHSIQTKNEDLRFVDIEKNNKMEETGLNLQEVDFIIDHAFREDIGTGDITSNNLIPENTIAKANMTAKANGVIAGLPIAKKVFEKLDSNLIWKPLIKDGQHVKKGDLIVEIEASFRALLTGERLALNLLQRLSGIASETAKYVKEVEGSKVKILDTRKTAPGLRIFDKYAVKMGGGTNHRIGLFDLAMIKDNHIKIAGGIEKAVNQVRKAISADIKIEVETTTLDEVDQAVNAGVDVIMLDNMSNELMTKAVKLINGKCLVEASGNMTIARLKEVTKTGVDLISVGALTHSVVALDISQNICQL